MGLLKKGPKVQRENYKILKSFREGVPENMYCADCGTREPKYASVNLGVFICNNCRHIHELLGPNVSVVKSIEKDIWSSEELKNFLTMGNANAKAIYGGSSRTVTVDYLRQKYESLNFVSEDSRRLSLINRRQNFLDNYHPQIQDGVDYAEIYKNEMDQLINIGFTKKKNNLKALILTGGNVEKAIDLISNAQEKHQRNKERYATMEYNPSPEEAEAIEQVKTMGFNIKNNTKSLYLVRKYNNDVNKIISHLLSKNESTLNHSGSISSLSSYSSSNGSNESEPEGFSNNAGTSSNLPPYSVSDNIGSNSNNDNSNIDFFNSIESPAPSYSAIDSSLNNNNNNNNMNMNNMNNMNNNDISSIFASNLQSPLSSQTNSKNKGKSLWEEFDSLSIQNDDNNNNNNNNNNVMGSQMASSSTSNNNNALSPLQQNSNPFDMSTSLSPQLSSPGQNQNQNQNNPYSMSLLNQNNSLSPQLNSNLSPQLNSNLSPQLNGSLSPQLNGSLSPQLNSGLSPQLNGSLSPQLNGSLSPQLNGSLSPQLNGSLSPQLNGSLSPQLNGNLSPQLNGSLSPQLNGSLSPQLNGSLSPQLNGSLSPQLSASGSPPLQLPSPLQLMNNQNNYQFSSSLKQQQQLQVIQQQKQLQGNSSIGRSNTLPSQYLSLQNNMNQFSDLSKRNTMLYNTTTTNNNNNNNDFDPFSSFSNTNNTNDNLSNNNNNNLIKDSFISNYNVNNANNNNLVLYNNNNNNNGNNSSSSLVPQGFFQNNNNINGNGIFDNSSYINGSTINNSLSSSSSKMFSSNNPFAKQLEKEMSSQTMNSGFGNINNDHNNINNNNFNNFNNFSNINGNNQNNQNKTNILDDNPFLI